jgi:hypothetical protein
LSIAKHIANRALEIYSITGANQCGRGMDEISMAWSTPEEEEKFHEMFESLATYARYIDNTMNKNERAGKWNDFRLAVTWQQFKDQFHALPKFRVRTDIVGESNKLPMRTGVYISQDDPNGALQFAWVGGTEGQLLECATFNELGLAALNVVGRKDLWINEDKMLAFLKTNNTNKLLTSDSFFNTSQTPTLAPSLVARRAFISRSCKWYFVEIINDEFENIEDDAEIPQRFYQNGGNIRPEYAGKIRRVGSV